jgi:acetolactate synthase-1/2/3 large subunit
MVVATKQTREDDESGSGEAVERMNGAHMTCEALVREGVEVLFGYPGGAVTPFYDALPDFPQLRHVLVRHEQASAHAADGYARATGKVGVCVATSGPGATNLVTGIATAYLDSSPIIAITGQVPTGQIGKDAFQEIDITGITLPITKHNYLVLNVNEVAHTVKEAFHIARTGRPGPVLVDLPKNVLSAEGRFVYPASVELRGYKPSVHGNARQVRQAASLIRHAKRPVVLVGRGVQLSEAHEALRQLAEEGDIPVLSTLLGLGSFPGSSPLSLGLVGMHGLAHGNRALSASDLVIAIGTRLSDRTTGRTASFASKAKVIQIDVDPAEIGKNIGVDVPIVGDIASVLQAILREGVKGDRGDWATQARRWREEAAAEAPRRGNGHAHPQAVIEGLNRETRGEGIIVTDVGQHQMWAAQYFVHDRPGGFISSGGLGTMGFGLPAALGAKLGRPNDSVWAVVGDGGLQMNIQEMATVVQERAAVKIALMNNGYLGMVRQLQEFFHAGRYSGIQISGPDFCKVAEAYGIPARRVERDEQIAEAYAWASSIDGPALVEFLIEPEENVYPMVPPGQSLEQMIEG